MSPTQNVCWAVGLAVVMAVLVGLATRDARR